MDVLVIYVSQGCFWTGISKYFNNKIMPFKGIKGVNIQGVKPSLELMSYVNEDVSLFIKYQENLERYRSFLGYSSYKCYDYEIEELCVGYGDSIEKCLEDLMINLRVMNLEVKRNK